jgi:hypothetical protein
MESDKIARLRSDFLGGSVPAESVPGRLEPLLVAAVEMSSNLAEGQRRVRSLVNGIELVVFTRNEPERSQMVLELLDEAVAFVGSLKASEPYPTP